MITSSPRRIPAFPWASASVAFALVAAGCTAAPAPTPAAHQSSAIEPSQDLPNMGYHFTLSRINVNTATWPSDLNRQPGTDPWTADTGYLVWAELAVKDSRPPHYTDGAVTTSACTLGWASSGDVLDNCKPGAANNGAFTAGNPLDVYSAFQHPDDMITLAIAVSNIEQMNPDAVKSSTNSTLAAIGDFTAGIATIFGFPEGAIAKAGALVAGALASEISVAGDLYVPPGAPTGSQFWEISCAGGMLAEATQDHPRIDTMFVHFTPQQLADLTVNGPANIHYRTHMEDTVAPYIPYCVSDLDIVLTVSREWADGLAAQSRSSDGAVARSYDEMDAFFARPAGKSGSVNLERRYWANGGWLTDSLPNAGLRAGQPIASLSPTKDTVEAYWIDTYGALQGISWHNGARLNLWNLTGNGSSAPYGVVTATARIGDHRDLFYLDGNGTLATLYWVGSSGQRHVGFISPTKVAPPGGAVAAVARTAENLYAFFVGNDGALHTSFWSEGGSGWGSGPVSGARLAPAGAPLTAVARTTKRLDVFFAGTDANGKGVVYQSAWNSDVNAWQTLPIGVTNGLVAPGAAIRSLSIASTSLNVVFVGTDQRLYHLASTVAGSNLWTVTPITAAGSTYGGGLALAARTPTIWNAFYVDGAGAAQGLDYSYGDAKWYPFTVPYATLRQGGLFPFGGADPSLCLDLATGSFAIDGSKLVSNHCNGHASQRFSFSPDGSIVSAVNPNLCVDSGNGLALRPCGATGSQSWYWLRGQLVTSTSQCLDVYYANHAPGTQLDVTGCNGTAAQLFLPFNLPVEIVTTQQSAPNDRSPIQPQCVTLQQTALVGVVARSQFCSGSSAQTFVIDDQARLVAQGSCLDGTVNKNGVGQLSGNSCGTQATQHWSFDGTHLLGYPVAFSLTGSNTPGCMDVYFNQQTPGTNIDYTACNGTAAQNYALADFAGGHWPFAALP